MKARILIIALFLFGLSCFGQTTKVIALTSDEAAQMKSLYEQKAGIQREIDTLEKAINEKYVYNPRTHATTEGFEFGFEFSTDFKYIVPKRTPTTEYIPVSPPWVLSHGTGCLTTICAYN